MVMASTTLAAYAQKTLTILHTNDTHSCIYPLKATLRDTAIAGRGGFLRRIAMLRRNGPRIPTCCFSTVAISLRGRPSIRSSRAMWRLG